MPAIIVCWIGIGIPVFAYLGYPLLLIVLGAIIRRPVKRAPFEPAVSLLIPAFNEAKVIADKIRNVRALDYPADRLEVVVACDGSRDGTAEIAGGLADDERVRVVSYPTNRGKIVVLNDTVPRLRGEIVVFSDAAAMLRPDAVRRLMTNFADPRVGSAGGRYTIVRPEDVGLGRSEDVYWRYETFLKTRESILGSTIGVHGQLHAIRKELYPFPRAGTINDDFVIPLSVVAAGYRAVYDPAAVAYEPAEQMTGFGRRVRIARGNLQQLRELGPLLHPPRVLPLFVFFSHKVLRLLVPFAMVAALVANAFLVAHPVYRALFAAQAGFYLLALAGLVAPLRPRILALPYYFTMINAAVFVALYQLLRGRRSAWK